MGEATRPRLGGKAKIGGDVDPEVFCSDEQNVVDVDLARWQLLAEQVLHAEGIRGGTELSLIFVGESDIAELNESFLGRSGPTDVLSFPIDAAELDLGMMTAGASRGPDRAPFDPSDLPLLLGDVVICPAVAVAQAPAHAGTADDELALLVVHGILHVLGHDHVQPVETAAMRLRELQLLEQLHWHGPAPTGFCHDQPDEDQTKL
ncbi:MAG: rRNA maturation RNase YbeY [Ilumatobacteraceae bacterium]